MYEYDFRYDALTIFDGPSADSTLIGKHCGSSLPSSFVSSVNKIYIHFTSDAAKNGPGFELAYESTSELSHTDNR